MVRALPEAPLPVPLLRGITQPTHRSMRTLLFLLVASSTAAAQAPDTTSAHALRSGHALPFGSAGNVIELVLGDDAAGPLTVAVVSAPAWLAFDRTEATSETAGGTAEPVARLAFAVAREAPVGVPADIVLAVRDAAGALVAEKTVRVEVSAPLALAVDPPRPNPSRGAAVVPYLTPAAGRVRVSVFDLLGREVAVLVDADEPAGAHAARVPSGRLAAGVYVVRVVAGGEARVARLTVVR